MGKKIGVKFPPDYKKIVEKYNGAYVLDTEAYEFYSNFSQAHATHDLGLMHALGGEVDSATETMEWSLENKPFGFPSELVSFARDGRGNLLCFDYRDSKYDSEPKIVLWHIDGQPGSGRELSYIAPTFNKFLGMVIKE
ncbi:SMI1/KNR4 family protein [Massilia antarctica]|uniref:SMI1/KNR4 family protein n=1 Tax=Massilia antarctica TaxID=2765360 RepID=A0AA48W608_9BURK|nr:SMI1/KNR4 family protein [Massilia antarctica]QPI47483.1 SMI1/KNR4 family protein [Massilia antarctica]